MICRAIDVLPGCDFTHAYGQTECAPIVTTNGPDTHRGEGLEADMFKSCGRPAVNLDVEIVDENGREVPPGTVGELRVRGPNVMLGYWNKPDETAAALRDGWMHSGDGARMDENGYIFIVDRVKDMIVSGGENVYSAAVRRNLIMPGFWARRWRSPIPSTRYAGVPRSSSPISSTTAVAI